MLDCSCGIGTQAIGLARRGYRVHATDLSERSIDRARAESGRLGAEVSFGVADFRDLGAVEGAFDVVISCDNAIPHLLDDADVATALRSMRSKVRPGGLLVVSVRDAGEPLPELAPPQLIPGPPRRLVVRLHDWDPDRTAYTLHLFLLVEVTPGWRLSRHSARYRLLTQPALARAVEDAGFTHATWRGAREAGFHQPLLTAFA